MGHRVNKNELFNHAAWFAFQGAPPKDWGEYIACENVPDDFRPEEAEHVASRNEKARNFIAHYCANCVVRIECVLNMMQQSAPEIDAVFGGMMPSEARRMAEAVKEIEQYDDLASASIALGRELIPREPIPKVSQKSIGLAAEATIFTVQRPDGTVGYVL
jgi:hypothetical protein